MHLLAYQARYEFQINGVLKKISSDELVDEITKSRYYQGIVVVDDSDIRKANAKLIPGMPVVALIQTGERTVMAYLLDPITRIYKFAFREK